MSHNSQYSQYSQGFTIRAFVLPDEEYGHLADIDLDDLISLWERTFQDAFGVKEMIYNVHIWVSE